MMKQAIWMVLLAAGAWAQSPGDATAAQESKLIVLEHMWNDAQVHRDARALAGLIGDRFSNTEYDGEISDREQFLADIANPEFETTSENVRDLKVNLYGDTAVVTGIYHTKGTVSGKPYDHVGRFTDTWVLQDGRWLCVASHTSLLKK
jgi:ketosteroid isomerase-like protein